MNLILAKSKFNPCKSDCQRDLIEGGRKVMKDSNVEEVNESCGYYPPQVEEANLPVNLNAGRCARNPVYKQFNENLFTTAIQPGIYTKNEVNDAVNGNIGISFAQQFHPLVMTKKNVVSEVDGRLVDEVIEEETDENDISNIYDPRFSGYGTSQKGIC